LPEPSRAVDDKLARVTPADDRVGVMPATLLAVERKPEPVA
jgi:hypothetical protein